MLDDLDELREGDMLRHKKTGKLWGVDGVYFKATKRPEGKVGPIPAFTEYVQMHPIDQDPVMGREFKAKTLGRTFHREAIAG